MKRKELGSFFKKGVSLALAVTLTLALSACGSDNKGTKKADSSLSRQNVFKVQELKLSSGDENDYGVDDAAYFNERLYYMIESYSYSYGYDEEGTAQAQNPYKLISTKTDGTDRQETAIELPDAPGYNSWGDNGWDDGEVIIYGDPTMERGEEEAQEEGSAVTEDADADARSGAEEKIVPGTVDILPIDDLGGSDQSYGYESTNYYNFQFTSDGKLMGLENHNKSENGSEGYVNEQETFLCLWNLDGKLSQKISLKDYLGENSWVNHVVEIGKGQLMMTFYSEASEGYARILVSTEDGKAVKKESKNGESEWWQDFSNIIVKPDGSGTYVFYYGGENWTAMVAEYDPKTDTLSEGKELPQILKNNGYNDVSVSSDGSLIFSGSGALYKYHLGDTDLTEFMNCVNSDVATYGINNLIVLDDDHFVGTYYEYSTDSTISGYFTRVAPEDVVEKETIVLGMNWQNMEVVGRVVGYNKKSDKYRIVVTDYSQYNTDEDWSAGMTKLNNDIISGNMPDIIIVTNEIPAASYISKGLLADIDKLIAEDEELSKNEYLQNVFDAYRVNGKLYYLISSFSVNTLMGKTSEIGERTTWTMEEFLNKANSLSDGKGMFPANYTRGEFIYNMMRFCGSDFVDVSTGKCAFNTDNFMRMLEYAKTLPEVLSDDFYEDGKYWETYESQYRDGRTVLMDTYISSMDNLNYNINGYFGADVSFVGFPTDSGKGSVLQSAGQMYALSAKSANLDGAWEFIRYYLTDEYQENLDWQIPVSKKAFDEWAAKGTQKPYWIDENGEKYEYDNTFWMNGESIVLPVFTQAQVDKIKNFVTSVDKAVYYNQDVINIVTEEAEAFFSGQKSAKDVADIIQSRVSIYVNE